MHGSLVEVGELAVGYLGISVQGQDGGGVVGCVSYEVATDEVVGSLWESDDGSELLIKVVWN